MTTDDDLRRTWEDQQAVHKIDREQRFAVMLDYVERLTGAPKRVLDLACGPGSITRRVLDRFPAVRVVAVDLDPLLLRLATGAFAGDERVNVLSRNLDHPDWTTGIDGDFDAVLTATALHWLSPPAFARVCRAVAGLIRPGGVFLNADHVLIDDERLRAAADALHQQHLDTAFAAGVQSCDDWYRRAYALPQYRSLWAERQRLFTHWSGDLMRSASWHLDELHAAGFETADVVWRYGNNAVTVAIR
ncbi:class I SAM-dependent methyltransferase [Kribbella capetownensis]|uniref:Class I SAM-dependent methyltransferase n=1 Tax=Kribbella capetownensis TaxID=1572659 RepID=A0A4R0JZZ3_9ACTN|nr:class I SAM-dependent methyltransferase [Kribbella capetownensis]TCC52490.1 class I SAM-dependent methyltransferase [Kribbella capetownensis]